jgi:CheY-like chemotaxis protein
MQSGERFSALIISDDRQTRATTRVILEEYGYVVRSVMSQDAGLEILRTDVPDVVLFHVDLPGGMLSAPDEVAILSELLRNRHLANQHAFVLISRTPNETDEVLGHLLDRVAVRMLALPCTSAHLVEAIASALERRHIARTAIADAMTGAQQTAP